MDINTCNIFWKECVQIDTFHKIKTVIPQLVLVKTYWEMLIV